MAKVKRNKPLPGLTLRQQQNAMRAGGEAVAAAFHEEIKPRKFLNSAMERYGLRARTRKYNKRKLAGDGKVQGGRVRPFVYTGETRQLVLSRRVAVVTATSQRAKVKITMYAPALNYLPWVREEFERKRDDETKYLERVSVRAFGKRLKQGA